MQQHADASTHVHAEVVASAFFSSSSSLSSSTPNTLQFTLFQQALEQLNADGKESRSRHTDLEEGTAIAADSRTISLGPVQLRFQNEPITTTTSSSGGKRVRFANTSAAGARRAQDSSNESNRARTRCLVVKLRRGVRCMQRIVCQLCPQQQKQQQQQQQRQKGDPTTRCNLCGYDPHLQQLFDTFCVPPYWHSSRCTQVEMLGRMLERAGAAPLHTNVYLLQQLIGHHLAGSNNRSSNEASHFHLQPAEELYHMAVYLVRCMRLLQLSVHSASTATAATATATAVTGSDAVGDPSSHPCFPLINWSARLAVRMLLACLSLLLRSASAQDLRRKPPLRYLLQRCLLSLAILYAYGGNDSRSNEYIAVLARVLKR